MSGAKCSRTTHLLRAVEGARTGGNPSPPSCGGRGSRNMTTLGGGVPRQSLAKDGSKEGSRTP